MYSFWALLFQILTGRIQISISLSTIIILLAFTAWGTWTFIRYKYLNLYEKLSSEPYDNAVKEKPFIESPDEESKSGFSSYLEEFLSAIKIFGYLDKPVFHELTRSMRTQRLDAGELFALDSSLGFAIVVEGYVNVYSKVVGGELDYSRSSLDPSGFSDTYMLNGEKFQLINYVKTGNPLSSLVSILSLFTDDISNKPNFMNNNNDQIVFRVMDQSPLDNNQSLEIFPEYLGNPYDETFDDSNINNKELSSQSPGSSSPIPNELPDLIAQAKTDCTIAIIPAESFKKLTRKWPRSASHIVQVVLTRLYRVTFHAAHNYLGMTREIFDTEVKLNQSTNNELPKYLSDGVIKQIDDQMLQAEKLSPGLSENKKPPVKRRNNSFSISSSVSNSIILEKEPNNNEELTSSVGSLKRQHLNRTHSRHVVLDSRNAHHPGDLLSNVPISRTGFSKLSKRTNSSNDLKTKTFSAEEETEDTAIRIAVAESLFRILGIDEKSINGSILQFSNSSSLFNLNQTSRSPSVSLKDDFSAKHYKKGFFSEKSSRRNSIFSDDQHSNLDFDQAKGEFADGVKFLFVEKGTTLTKQNDANSGLYYVISGELNVSFRETTVYNGILEQKLYTAYPGHLAGYLASFVGHKSFATIKANTDSYVGFIPQDTLNSLCEKFFTIHLSIAKKLVSTMSKDLLDMDFAVEWVQSKAGHKLFEQGFSATGIYIVLSGRFREVRKINDTKVETLGEYGQGSSLSEVEVLTATKRETSLIAVRDSEAARIPRYLFEFLALKNPSIMINISRLVAKKMAAKNKTEFDYSLAPSPIHRSNSKTFFPNYKTITLLPTKYGLPVAEFAEKLILEFKKLNKSVIALNQASILNHLGKYAFDKLAKLKQSGYFSDLEESCDLVIYVCDTPVNSNWSHTCIAQGDLIMLLADATSTPEVGDYERLLLKSKTSARTELILMHPERYVSPGSTSKWLKNRLWVEAHHHVQFHLGSGTSAFEANLSDRSSEIPGLFLWNLKTKVTSLTQDFVGRFGNGKKFYTPVNPHKNDFARIARIISGQAIGLVLGGGGARGISHIGVIQTLESEGIPIDLIGGTSIGAFVGGLYAKDYDIVPIYGRAKKFSGRVASIWRTLSDLTYPLVSYTTGHEFNRGVWKSFGDSRIEDFWLRYFCNSTNITNSVMEIHTSGYAWRFIRASMSLCGLVPPIVDQGNMLLDGGYVDNLPVSEMKRQGAKIIFAIDVGSVDDRTPMTYGDSLSGFLELINRYNPFSRSPVVPSMADIQLRLAYVGSVGALEEAKITPGVFYMRPPIENFGTLAFSKFNEIYEVGKTYAIEEINRLRISGKIPEKFVDDLPKRQFGKIRRQRRNSI